MRTFRALLVISTTAPILVGCTPMRGGGSPRANNRIAVVETEKVFNEYKKSIDRKTEVDTKANELFEKGRDLKAQKTALQNELEKYEVGSPEYEAEQKKIDDLSTKEKSFEEELRKLYQSRDSIIQEINLEIIREIRAMASDRGYDVVLEKQLVLKGLSRQPLSWPLTHYVRPSLDMTTDLIERLNSKYLRAKNAN